MPKKQISNIEKNDSKKRILCQTLRPENFGIISHSCICFRNKLITRIEIILILLSEYIPLMNIGSSLSNKRSYWQRIYSRSFEFHFKQKFQKKLREKFYNSTFINWSVNELCIEKDQPMPILSTNKIINIRFKSTFAYAILTNILIKRISYWQPSFFFTYIYFVNFD